MKDNSFFVQDIITRLDRYFENHKSMAVVTGIIVLLVAFSQGVDVGHKIGKFIYYITH